MEPSEEVHHISLLFERMSGDNDLKLKLVERLRKATIAYLKKDHVIPPNADLTDYEQAAYYCLEIQNNQKYALYRSAAHVLRTCNHALETGKVERWHINGILGSWPNINKAEETKTVISNKASENGKRNPGRKIYQPILKVLQKFVKENPDVMELSNNAIANRFADWLPEELDNDHDCYIEHEGRDWKIFWTKGKEEKDKKRINKCIFAEPDKITKTSKIISVKLDAIRKNYIPKIREVGV
jgi:hypothetical protein